MSLSYFYPFREMCPCGNPEYIGVSDGFILGLCPKPCRGIVSPGAPYSKSPCPHNGGRGICRREVWREILSLRRGCGGGAPT